MSVSDDSDLLSRKIVMAESRSEPQNAFVILPVRQVFFLFVFLIDVYILFAEALCSGPDKLEQVGYGFRNLSFNVFFS